MVQLKGKLKPEATLVVEKDKEIFLLDACGVESTMTVLTVSVSTFVSGILW
jgi:hypothetical protein